MEPKLRVWTEGEVRAELPDVPVTFLDGEGKPVTILCVVRGRKEHWATVRPFEHGSAVEWAFSWGAITHSLNTGRALKV